MTRDELRSTVLEALGNIAPDADVAHLAPDRDLREALDIDSMDFLRFVLALHDRLGIDVPEADYARLYTLNGAVAYLAGRLGTG